MLVLLPCQSLEDLSLNRSAEEAEEMLGAWSAMFHPALLKHFDKLPDWDRAAYPMTEHGHQLIVIPPCCEEEVPDAWPEEMEKKGAVVLRGLKNRDEILREALRAFSLEEHGFDDETVADFLALGYGYIAVELLTRQLRYMSNLDDVQLKHEVERILEVLPQGDAEAIEQRKRAAFDLLTEAREYFYPVDSYLLDLTLTAPTTLGQSLRDELTGAAHVNLFLPGPALQAMIDDAPETLAALKTAVAEERVTIIGGERRELPLPMLPIEALVSHLRSGVDFYEEHVGLRPTVFARATRGLAACLPQLLHELGYQGALHYTLDGALHQKANQSKVRWKGDDGAVIDALVRYPLDAGDPSVFMRLPEALGETMDLDHAATIVFAHWPGRACRWHDAVRRIVRRSPALGDVLALHQYFINTQYSGQSKSYSADAYRSGALAQDVAAGRTDPVSRWTRYFARCAGAGRLQGLHSMRCLAGAAPGDLAAVRSLVDETVDPERALDPAFDRTRQDALSSKIDDAIDTTSRDVAETLPVDAESTEQGVLVVNPLPFEDRRLIDISTLDELPPSGDAVVLTVAEGDKKCAVVDVPPLGYAWVGRGHAREETQTPKKQSMFGSLWKKSTAEKPMVEETTLRNDYFEVAIDPTTGQMKSLHSFDVRGNRLAQQAAFRFPENDRKGDTRSSEDPHFGYTVMAADKIEIEQAGPLEGVLRTEGRLLATDGREVARFEQRHIVRRASRVLEIDLTIDPTAEPGDNPWDSYYAMRFAWADATADWSRGVHSASYPMDVDLIEAPEYLDLRSGKRSLTLLGGLPFHRRFGLRRLDTLLIPRGETERRFRVGVGVDIPNPARAAMAFMTPDALTHASVRAPRPRHAWLEHIDARNVNVIDREMLVQDGRLTGCLLHLLETDGLACDAGVRLCRPVTAARRMKLNGDVKNELAIKTDRIAVPMKPRELAAVEIDFA